MNRVVILASAIVAACSPAAQQKLEAAMASRPGQVLCAVQTQGGGTILVGLTTAVGGAVAPGAAPLIMVTTNLTKAVIDQKCAEAAQKVPGGTIAVAVPAPAAPVPVTPVVVEKPSTAVAH